MWLVSCPFVDNCVGRRNYVFFIGFVGFLAVDIIVTEYVMWLDWDIYGMRVWELVVMIFFLLVLLPVVELFLFHVYLTAKNLTTNEVMNSHRYRYMRGAHGGYHNPFDQGLIHNFADRCLPDYVMSEHDHSQCGNPDHAEAARLAGQMPEVAV